MYNNTIIYIFNRIISVAIFLFILYLIFTNFGTFLIIITILVSIIAFIIYNFKKKLKQSNFNNFEFRFDNSQFQNGKFDFDFKDFQNFNNSNFQGFSNTARFDEVSKAKEFFGFTQTPTKEEVKKRYKELAKKYHPDLNDGNEEKMKELNHYRDILMNIVQ
ncbi:J domain-containing protein [Aliarcobacter butzleri]|uniref:J domain-containing protein n=1 Tax=Aliarcobacter butzleri TaxID=28197 RepID=UPI001260683A|nr:DnaJ domain-containing protein [Aliarcobacter butzleri]MDN5095711.1 DnaJ domain-containing protein [Aliarcobacter butzleri]MDN5127031.1 DnaJ domain-containing protein [Aliarcobacter butzleri]